MSNTTVRILVALVGIPLVMFLVFQGGWFFFVFVELIAVLAVKELYDLAQHKSTQPNAILGYAGSLAAGAYFFFEHTLDTRYHVQALSFTSLLAVLTLLVLTHELWRNKPNPLWNTSVTVMGVVYIAFFLETLIGLREMFVHLPAESPVFAGVEAALRTTKADAFGFWLVMCVFSGIWICDSAAFFAGKAFGKHKLFPRVSPNKSWEGAIVGFIMSAIGFAALAHYMLPFLPILHGVILGAIIGIVGQIGDLVESLLKRDAGIKDSSNIIPGHGGIFDRFDSIIFVAPVAYMYIKSYLLFGV